MKNSIEEDIKNAEHFIKSIKTDKEYKEENGWHGYYNKEIVELARMLEHILSDYKRVLKENEELKVSDSSNSKIIANMSTRHFQDREKIRNSIPIQKIKDIFNVKIHNFNYLSETDCSEIQKYKDKEIADILERILQELLEGSNK